MKTLTKILGISAFTLALAGSDCRDEVTYRPEVPTASRIDEKIKTAESDYFQRFVNAYGENNYNELTIGEQEDVKAMFSPTKEKVLHGEQELWCELYENPKKLKAQIEKTLPKERKGETYSFDANKLSRSRIKKLEKMIPWDLVGPPEKISEANNLVIYMLDRLDRKDFTTGISFF